MDEWDLRHLLLSLGPAPPEPEDAVGFERAIGRAVASLRARPPAPPERVADGVERVECSFLASNAWIVRGPASTCLLVDVPADPEPLVDLVRALDLRVAGVLITHGHIDHAGGLATALHLLDAYDALDGDGDVPVLAAAGDVEWIVDPAREAGVLAPAFGPSLRGLPADRITVVEDGQHLRIGGIDVTVCSTPGHSLGSVCFLVHRGERAPLLFTGDSLFAGGAGRTDRAGGDRARLLRSLARVTRGLPAATLVLPGHGGATRLGAERAANPLLREALGLSVPS